MAAVMISVKAGGLEILLSIRRVVAGGYEPPSHAKVRAGGLEILLSIGRVIAGSYEPPSHATVKAGGLEILLSIGWVRWIFEGSGKFAKFVGVRIFNRA